MASGNFNHFDSELQKLLSAAETGMEKAVTKLETDTRMITHTGVGTAAPGTLKRSWTHKTQTDKDGNIIGAVGSNVEYAPYEDALHPNISQALDDNLDSYMQTVSKEIEKAIGGDSNG